MAFLLTKKVTVLAKYLAFADVFLKKWANVLPKQIGVNEYAIKLEKGKQPPYGPIYSLELFELKTVKTYIETNWANGFVWASKLLVSASILFIRKSNSSLCLYVNYQRLNNLTIKNWSLLPLIGKSLKRLSQAKQFTQIDFTSAYHWMRIKENDKEKMAFWTWYGYFKYQIILFRLSNTLVNFQGYINKILAKKLNIFVIIYLNNIFIYIKY